MISNTKIFSTTVLSDQISTFHDSMRELTQAHLAHPSNKFKVGFVGPSKPQWQNPQQYDMMIRWVQHLLKCYRDGFIPIIFKEGESAYPSPTSFGRGEKFEGKLVIVSGHCPVGVEKPYCLECSSFQDGTLFWWKQHKDHKKLLLYTEGGVDTETEIYANKFNLKTEIYPAPAKDWNDKKISRNCTCGDPRCTDIYTEKLLGYRSRNLQIAKAINILYCIVPMTNMICKHHDTNEKCLGHPNNGGCFTLKHAKKLGKETHLILVK